MTNQPIRKWPNFVRHENLVAYTPNGREIRKEGDKYAVQPHNDNYWVECNSVAEAMYRYHYPHGDITAHQIARLIVDSWGDKFSINETAEMGVSEEDIRDIRESYSDQSAEIVVEIIRICESEREAV